MTPDTTTLPVKGSDNGPSRGWYFFSLFLFLVFGIGGVIYFILSLFTMLGAGTQFVVPGEMELTVEEPGTYTLYSETSVLYRGRMYPGSPDLPDDVIIDIRSLSSGETIPLEPTLHGEETVGSHVRYPVGSFTASAPGRYSIAVNGSFSERIFFVRRSICGELVTAFAIMVFSLMIGWLGAPVIAIVVFAMRSSRKGGGERTQPGVQEQGSAGARRPSAMSADSEQTWATFCHLGSFAGYVFPLGNILAPLILWLVKKDESDLIDDQGRESVNFQISMLIYYIVSALLSCIIIGLLLLAALAVFNIVVVIIGSVRANRGERYRYPLCIRFIR